MVPFIMMVCLWNDAGGRRVAPVHRWEVIRENSTSNLWCRGRAEDPVRIVAFLVSGRWKGWSPAGVRLVVSALGVVVASQGDLGPDWSWAGESLILGTQIDRLFRAAIHGHLWSHELTGGIPFGW